VSRCLARDEHAWRLLVARYSGLVHSVALRQGAGADLAHEVFQSVLITLAERLHLIQDSTCLPKWLMTTTARRLELMRRRARREAQGTASPAPDGDPDDPERQAERAELRAHVAAAMEELPARDRAVLEDLFERELPYAEVTKRHGLAMGSLGALRGRALARLRRILERRGIT
jgi:RNA polymerase sigma factor (sigma-70 family)